MLVSTAQSYVRQFARNAGDSTMYTDADVDRAIQLVGQRFCRVTRCVKTLSSLTLTAASAALPAFPTGFTPKHLIRAYIADNPALRITDTDTLRRQRDRMARSDVPELVAFDSTTTGEVFPTPDTGYTLKFLWWEAFTTWTPGSTPTTLLNVPDDLLIEWLPFGPPAVLQGNEPEHKYAGPMWQRYLEVENSLRDGGTLGVRTVDRVLDEADSGSIVFVREG